MLLSIIIPCYNEEVALRAAHKRLSNVLSQLPGLDYEPIKVIKQMPERTRFLRGMVSWAGFRQVSIPYDSAARHAGDSKRRPLYVVQES